MPCVCMFMHARMHVRTHCMCAHVGTAKATRKPAFLVKDAKGTKDKDKNKVPRDCRPPAHPTLA